MLNLKRSLRYCVKLACLEKIHTQPSISGPSCLPTSYMHRIELSCNFAFRHCLNMSTSSSCTARYTSIHYTCSRLFKRKCKIMLVVMLIEKWRHIFSGDVLNMAIIKHPLTSMISTTNSSPVFCVVAQPCWDESTSCSRPGLVIAPLVPLVPYLVHTHPYLPARNEKNDVKLWLKKASSSRAMQPFTTFVWNDKMGEALELVSHWNWGTGAAQTEATDDSCCQDVATWFKIQIHSLTKCRPHVGSIGGNVDIEKCPPAIKYNLDSSMIQSQKPTSWKYSNKKETESQKLRRPTSVGLPSGKLT